MLLPATTASCLLPAAAATTSLDEQTSCRFYNVRAGREDLLLLLPALDEEDLQPLLPATSLLLRGRFTGLPTDETDCVRLKKNKHSTGRTLPGTSRVHTLLWPPGVSSTRITPYTSDTVSITPINNITHPVGYRT